jgi:hypothetical protein
MAYQIVAVNDASPGACVDVGLVWNGSDTLTSTEAYSGTSITLTGGITGGASTDITLNTDKFTVDATNGNTVIAGTLTQTGAVAAAASITLGAGADLIGSSTSDITINTDKFTVAGATGNTVIAGTLTQTGAVSAAASITLGAGADLIGSATSDITINTDKFTVAGATGNTVIAGTCDITGAVGSAASITLGAGADLIGSATSDITINTDKFTVAGATGNTAIGGTLAVTGKTTFSESVTLGATSNSALSGAQAINLDKAYHGYTTNATAELALSLADGQTGQHLWLKMELKDTNNAVITPTNFADGSTITLDATGEYAHLVFSSDGDWHVVETNGTVA